MKKMYYIIPVVVIILALVVSVMRQINVYKNAESVYYKPDIEPKLMAIYDRELSDWPIDYTSQYVDTDYGQVHVIECGNPDREDVVLFHAASVGAISWKNNVEALANDYHIFCIDTLGEGNRSRLKDINDHPQTEQEVADLYHDVFQKLGIEKPRIAGASYGGFIAMNYARFYPDNISKLTMIGPMGISTKVGKTVAIMTSYTFFPYELFAGPITNWALGDNENLNELEDYFSLILKGVLGRTKQPVTLKSEELEEVTVESLLILGTEDALVGDPDDAIEYASAIPNLETLTLESGHLINVEKYTEVNEALLTFFKGE